MILKTLPIIMKMAGKTKIRRTDMYHPRRKEKKKPATLIAIVSRNFPILSPKDSYIAWLSLLSLALSSVILTSESNQAISCERMALKYATLVF